MQRGKGKKGQSSGTQEPPNLFTRLLPTGLHPNLVFSPNNQYYNEFNEALTNVLRQNCEYPRSIDWNPLNQVNYTHNITKALTQSIRYDGEVYDVNDLEKLIAIQEPIYLELCQEFFSTVRMYVISSIDDIFLTFHLGGRHQSLSLREMAVALQIYTDEELEAPWFVTYIMTGERLDEGPISEDDWAQFSDQPYRAGKNPSSAINSVKYKILQKLIAHTIALRGQNTEKVTKADIWYLLRLKNRERMNLPYCVGKYLYVYASGPKPESRMCGGQFITRIARAKNIDLEPRNHPYTLVPNPGLVVGVEMFRTAGAVRMKRGKYLPFSESSSRLSSRLEPREGSRVRGSTSQNEFEEEAEDEEEEDVAQDDDEEMHDAGGQHPQYQGPPDWQQLMTGFNDMRLEQSNFRDESRYEWGANRYQNDWLIHNTERLFHGVPDLNPTPYHHPPHWGEPGGVLPAPVYDRDAALVELQRHQEHMSTAAYHTQQQTWGTSWFIPEPSNWQQQAMHDWLFQPHQQQPPRDPSQD